MARIPNVRGFRWSGVVAGIKSAKKPDLALLVADHPVPAAGMFTTNIVRAAPVDVARRHLRAGRAQAVLVNSGNANACTGAAGLAATKRSVAALARELDIARTSVLPASTGVIGKPLPVDRIERAIPPLVRELSVSNADAFSEAILTTDRGRKVAVETFRIGATTARVVAIAKGAGMIHPDMATTLAFVATDAAIGSAALAAALRSAVDTTFNAISVDGDTSTNDTILALASGAVGKATDGGKGAKAFAQALEATLRSVSDMIVADGEGARHLVRVEVLGAPSDAAARKVASTIAQSLLVKTALHGEDPNWGRILAAAGRAGVPFDPTRASLHIGGAELVRNGRGLGAAAEARVAKAMKKPTYAISLRLGTGRGAATYTTCDIGHGYVDVNAAYRT